MTNSSGGVAAAFGFRYQYLVTVEVLLDLYANGSKSWKVHVDPVNQDSADIIVHLGQDAAAERVIQVKASLPGSSTTIGAPAIRRMLAGLQSEHPQAQRREVTTNRTPTAGLVRELADPDSTLFKSNEAFTPRADSPQQLAESLLGAVADLRAVGHGGTGRELQYLLLRQLVDRVHEAGSNPQHQSLEHSDIRVILEGANPILSKAMGARSWGKLIQVPAGDYIERREPANFLRSQLPASSLYDGTPQIAVLTGLSGTGKSVAACLHARSLSEHIAFALWLDASSITALESQAPLILDQLGARSTSSGASAQEFVEILSNLPVPWILVLDGVSSLGEVDRWIPRSGYGQVIVTTSETNWPSSFAPSLHMDAFSEAESRLFVARRLRQTMDSWSTQQLSACDAVCQSLARWPLALEIAVGWIVRHGGSIEAMQQFAKRMDRLDLNDETLLPHGYPRTATNVILSYWEELSEEAKLFASYLLMAGGFRVPVRFLMDALPVPGVAARAKEELLSSAFMRQEITASGHPHDFDETVTIHGFVYLIMEKQGVVLGPDSFLSLLNTSHKWVQQLTEDGRFHEGATLVRPVDHILRTLVVNSNDQPELAIHFSGLMHNLAQLSYVTSRPELARFWSWGAFNVRLNRVDLVNDYPAWVQMQLQTLSFIAVTLARLNRFEELVTVAANAMSLLNSVEYSIEDEQTKSSLFVLRDVLQISILGQGSREVRDLLQRIDTLIPQSTPRPQISGSGNKLISVLQIEIDAGLHLVQHSAWEEGVDTALRAANLALEQGAMVDDMIEGLLGVGLELMVEATNRPMEIPELLMDSVKRIVVWLNENSASFRPDQVSRHSILESFISGRVDALTKAVSDFPPPAERTHQLDAWAELATILNGQLASMHRRQMFADPPPFMDITYSLDGGDDLNVWWRKSRWSLLELWVKAQGVVTFTASGRMDPMRMIMERAGLKESNIEDPIQTADGWSAIAGEGKIEIFDANGVRWVYVEEILDDIINGVIVQGGVMLIYGDLAVTKATDRILSGWVPLVVVENESVDIIVEDPEHPSERWWRRLLSWLR